MSLYGLIIIVLIVLVAAYVINRVLSIPEPIKTIFNVVLGLALVVLVLALTGVIGTLQSIRIGPP
jgi:hypothetical protein